MRTLRIVSKCFFILMLGLLSLQAWGRCTRTGLSNASDSVTALIPFGKVNLYDTYFYPVGSLLGSAIVPPTNYTYGGVNALSVLWTCDTTDLPNISFLVATNGDDRVGGFYNIGTADGLSDVYATYFAYVGIKQSMNGVVLTRYWKRIPLKTYGVSGNKIQIRLMDIPVLRAELYRVSTLPGTAARSAFCGNNNSAGAGIVYGTATGAPYSCIQPNSYVQLSGPGLPHDEEGEDSAIHYDFFASNGIGYGMRNVNRLYNTPTCVARSATPLVSLPPISITDLNNGMTSSAPFNISIECSDSVASGAVGAQTVLGFQVSPGAYSAAYTLRLVNSSGGVSILLSDNYTAPNMAKEVGIVIAYSDEPDTPLTLVGQNNSDPLNIGNTSRSAGWYPVSNHAIPAGRTTPGYRYYNYNFIASLKRIDGWSSVSAGKVRSTVTVLVKLQ